MAATEARAHLSWADAIDWDRHSVDGRHFVVWSEHDYEGDVVWGVVEQFGPAYGLEVDYDWLAYGSPTRAEAMKQAGLSAEGLSDG